MDNNFSTNAWQQPANVSVSKTFMSGVFSWMGIALAISALTAYVFGTDLSYMRYLVNENSGGLSGLG